MTKLSESEKFNNFDINRLARQVRQNTGRSENGIIYQDDRRYNDYQGEKWLDVKSKDKKTLISAILDGMTDVAMEYNTPNTNHRYYGKFYKDINSEDDLEAAYKANKAAVDTILNYLSKYMRRHTTVYRGFSFYNDDYHKMKASNNIKFRHQLLKLLSNKGKKFNSFSVSPFVSRDFAQGGDGNISIIIAAEVEPNDIAFAFTAYLLGRHGSPQELELNINNLKDLKNLRIVEDIDAECARFVKYNDTEEELQKKLDSGESLEKVFEYVKKIKVFNDEIYRCTTLCGDVIVKDNKIIVPRCKDIHFIKEGIYVITPMDDQKERDILYNFNTKRQSEPYEGLFYNTASSDDKLIIASAGRNKYTLLDMETCKPKFNGYAKEITRLPGVQWYGEKNIWHSVEFYLLTLQNNMKTILNNNGKYVFKQQPLMYYSIECDPDELKITCEEGMNKYREFVIKNNMAVEKL